MYWLLHSVWTLWPHVSPPGFPHRSIGHCRLPQVCRWEVAFGQRRWRDGMENKMRLMKDSCCVKPVADCNVLGANRELRWEFSKSFKTRVSILFMVNSNVPSICCIVTHPLSLMHSIPTWPCTYCTKHSTEVAPGVKALKLSIILNANRSKIHYGLNLPIHSRPPVHWIIDFNRSWLSFGELWTYSVSKITLYHPFKCGNSNILLCGLASHTFSATISESDLQEKWWRM